MVLIVISSWVLSLGLRDHCPITERIGGFCFEGGAAAQFHLPVQMQRGSIDVDIVCPHTREEIVEVLSCIHARIPTVEFEKYTSKRPKKEISMVTYLARMPALISTESGRLREVKIDFLREESNEVTTLAKFVVTLQVSSLLSALYSFNINSRVGRMLWSFS
jgi:hypothetical protein